MLLCNLLLVIILLLYKSSIGFHLKRYNGFLLRPSTLQLKVMDRTSCIFHVEDIPKIRDQYDAISLGVPRILSSNAEGLWQLWFQVRDSSIPSNVLPLSTGRIIYATSKDGLRDFQIHSNSPILNPSKENGDWFYFDSEHVGLGDVIQAGSKSQARFQSDSNVYLMYTFGGNGEKLKLLSDGNEKEAQAIVGTKMEIGLAVSQDGLHWSKVEGSSPHASIIERGKSFDEYDGMFVGWPTVISMNGIYFMYYHTYNRLTNRYTICLATSDDGLLRWEKKGPVFDGGHESRDDFDGKGASRRHIHRLPDGSLRMYYEGISLTGKHAIGIATSRDGYHWTKLSNQPVLEASTSANAWDNGGVSSPHVVYLPEVSRWRLYYVGHPLHVVNKAEEGASIKEESILEGNGIGIAESLDESGLSFQRVQL